MPRTRAKRSLIWLHFSKFVDNDNAEVIKCNECKAMMQYCGNTTNLWSHIRIHHKETREKISKASTRLKDGHELLENDATISNLLENTQTILRKFGQVEADLSNSKRVEKINRSLIQMIADDMHSFSMIEDRGFINFVKSMDETYELPDKHFLTSKLLPELYENERHKIEEKLLGAVGVHLTIDSWTNRQMFFVSLTAHYCVGGTVQRNCLQVSHFPTSCSAEDLKETIIRTASLWKIATKIKTIVSNRSIDIASAVFLTPWQHIYCFGDSFNEIVLNSLKTAENVLEVIRKSKHIVRLVECSDIVTELSKQNKLLKIPTNPAKFVYSNSDDVTRWNDTYLMLDRILELRTTSSTGSGDCLQGFLSCLTVDEWTMILEISRILKPLHEATKEMCSDRYLMISKVIPIVHCVEAALRNQSHLIADQLRNNLLNELNKYFRNIEAHPVYAIATLLDPRYKDIVFNSSDCVNLAKSRLIAEYDDYEKQSNNSDTEPTIKTEADDKNLETNDNLWAAFDKKVQEKEADIDYSCTSLKNELNRYLNSKLISRKSNPITWWNTEGNSVFPKLTKVALEYLCIPATYIPSERLFSKTGEIVSVRRTHMQPEHLNMLAVLSSNDNA